MEGVLTFLAVKFIGNRLNESSNSQNGMGTISFYGRQLEITDSVFLKNVNTKGGAVLIDSNTRLRSVTIVVSNVSLEGNVVYYYGAGFILGNNLWEINANFTGINCFGNIAACKFLKIQSKNLPLHRCGMFFH